MNRRAPLCIPIVLASAVVAGATAFPAGAEIGAILDPGGPRRGGSLYVLSITDDPEPFNGRWLCLDGAPPVRHPLNCEGHRQGDGPPALVGHVASGSVLAAWADVTASGGTRLVVARFEDGAWTDPAPLPGAHGDARDPRWAVSADGTLDLLYWVEGPDGGDVHRMRADAGLNVWGPPVRVDRPGEDARRPWGAHGVDGLWVTYEVHGPAGAAPAIVVRAPSDPLDASSPSVVVDVRAPHPKIHVAGDRVRVGWIDVQQDGTVAGSLAWSERRGDGRWTPVRREPFDGALDRDDGAWLRILRDVPEAGDR